MATMKWVGLPIHDIIVPACVWFVIISIYIRQIYRRYSNKHNKHPLNEDDKYYRDYFYHMRGGWVRQNHLTMQAVANSTRDYLRVIIFLAGNSAGLGAILAGYAGRAASSASSPYDYYLVVKLACCGLLFFIIFFLYINSIRFGNQMHFLMNVEEANGVNMNLMIIERVFHRSWFFHAAGLRLHFAIIPLFAWVISSWALLAISPLYIYLVENYDNLSFLEQDLEDMYKGTSFDKSQPATALDSEELSDETAVSTVPIRLVRKRSNNESSI